MTENEIRKALECCRDCKCKECPCYKNIEGEMRCTEIDEEEILDLVNRQKAEIERLEEMLDSSVSSERNAVDNIDYEKTEAIKEFAERLKEKLQWDVEFDNKFVFESDIENLVKEMTGENEK